MKKYYIFTSLNLFVFPLKKASILIDWIKQITPDEMEWQVDKRQPFD